MVLFYVGVYIMAEIRRVTLSLAANLVEQVDIMVPMEYEDKSDLVSEAIKAFLDEKRKSELIEKLRQGYKEMSEINLGYAEMGLEVDVLDLAVYEAKLRRRELL